MKNYIQPGDQITLPAPAAVVAGALVVSGVLVGVANHDAASGATVTISTEGVFSLAKTSAQAWTIGQALYVIPATGLVTTANTTGNILIGTAAAVAVNPSATGIVRLNGSSPAAAA
jgi:predicted RecA/RadA family phage recombinase